MDMSLYVAWLNKIKESADESWLTDGQRKVYDRLLDSWQHHLFVNLYGASGCGKSFVARLLAKERDYVYCHDLKDAPIGSANAILDDAEYSRMLRPVARNCQLGRVVLVTRQRVREAMPSIELVLGERDLGQFAATLHSKCGITLIQTVPEGHDLAEILRREVIARGEAHVHQ